MSREVDRRRFLKKSLLTSAGTAAALGATGSDSSAQAAADKPLVQVRPGSNISSRSQEFDFFLPMTQALVRP